MITSVMLTIGTNIILRTYLYIIIRIKQILASIIPSLRIYFFIFLRAYVFINCRKSCHFARKRFKYGK